jgi:hypothetical protein
MKRNGEVEREEMPVDRPQAKAVAGIIISVRMYDIYIYILHPSIKQNN